MKQRIAAAMLITLMPLSLAACGGEKANSSSTTLRRSPAPLPPRTLPLLATSPRKTLARKSKRRWQTPAKP